MTKQKLEKIQLILAIIALTAPIGYLMGVGYHHGFLSAYHISPDAFPISIQDTYLNAYIFVQLLFIDVKQIVENIFISLLKAPLESFIYLFILYLVINFLVKIQKIKKYLLDVQIVKNLYEKINLEKVKENHIAVSTVLTAVYSYLFISILFVLGGLYALWAIVFFVPYQTAQNFAIDTRDTFIEKGCFFENKVFSNCKSLEKGDGTLIIKGLLVIQNTTHVAFFTNKGSSIIMIPQNSIIKSKIKRLSY